MTAVQWEPDVEKVHVDEPFTVMVKDAAFGDDDAYAMVSNPTMIDSAIAECDRIIEDITGHIEASNAEGGRPASPGAYFLRGKLRALRRRLAHERHLQRKGRKRSNQDENARAWIEAQERKRERRARHEALMAEQEAQEAVIQYDPAVQLARFCITTGKGVGKMRNGEEFDWAKASALVDLMDLQGHPLAQHVKAILAWSEECAQS